MASSAASARSKGAESVLSIYISSSSSSEGDSESEDGSTENNDRLLTTIPETIPSPITQREKVKAAGGCFLERKFSYRNFVNTAFTRIFPGKTGQQQTDIDSSSSSSNNSSRPTSPLEAKEPFSNSFHKDNIEDLEADEADPTIVSSSSSNIIDYEESEATEEESLSLNRPSATFESQTTASVNNTTTNRIAHLKLLKREKGAFLPPQDIEIGLDHEQKMQESSPLFLFSCMSLFLGIILGMILAFAIFSQVSRESESQVNLPPLVPATEPPANTGGFQFTSPSASPARISPTSHPSQDPPTTESGNVEGDQLHLDPSSTDNTIVPSSSPSLKPYTYSVSNSTNTSCPPFPAAEPLVGKRGIGLSMNPEGHSGSWVENLPKLNALNPSWFHSWGYSVPDAVPSSVEYVPTFPDANQHNLSSEEFQQHFAGPVALGKVKHVLGPDDPLMEHTSTGNLVQAWSRLEELNVPLIGPSPRQTLGSWMQSFMDEMENACGRVDWVGVKWYGRPSPEAFRQRMQKIYKAYQRPLLLTEFALQNDSSQSEPLSRAQVLAFMKAVLPWMEEQAWIAGYAWYPFDTGSVEGQASALFHTNGDLTELGQYYASVTTTNPTGDLTILVA